MSAPFSDLVEGGEHAIEAGARHREHEEARRIGADIAIAVAPMARRKEKCARTETQRVCRAFDFQRSRCSHLDPTVLVALAVLFALLLLIVDPENWTTS